MFGMKTTPQDPIASYEVSTDHLYRNQHPGTRGYVSSPDLLATGVVASNNSLMVQSKWVRPKVGAIRFQIGVLGPNAPLTLYENGTPAILKLTPNQGFQLAATFPGVRGNALALSLIDPGGTSAPLIVKAVPPGHIMVYLARTANAISTTSAQLVAALNASSAVQQYVTAWVSDTTLQNNPLTALPKTYFGGGMDIPYLVYVSTVANTAGAILTTAAQVIALLTGSKFVGATNSSGSSGGGAVTAMGPTPLTGGYLSTGAVLDEDANKLKLYQFDVTQGQGIEHMSNSGLQVARGRQGATRTWQAVPTKDREIVRDMRTTVGGTQIIGVNHQMEHAPRSLFL
jgi:hypothetical protein